MALAAIAEKKLDKPGLFPVERQRLWNECHPWNTPTNYFRSWLHFKPLLDGRIAIWDVVGFITIVDKLHDVEECMAVELTGPFEFRRLITGLCPIHLLPERAAPASTPVRPALTFEDLFK